MEFKTSFRLKQSSEKNLQACARKQSLMNPEKQTIRYIYKDRNRVIVSYLILFSRFT